MPAQVSMDTLWGFQAALTRAAEAGWGDATPNAPWSTQQAPTARDLAVRLSVEWTREIHLRALRSAYGNARMTSDALIEEECAGHD